jgi:outer membrane protein OmpA-like peptidoglycan-associated protein
LDDYDGDGQPDPTCGTQDFGAGLVLRIPCQISTAHDPDAGTVLVPKSLFQLPAISLPELDAISTNAIQARDAAGQKVVIFFLNSDALFDTGSATVTGPAAATFDGIITAIKNHYPNGSIQIRGHTDATGSASVNLALSQQRADAVKTYFGSHGLDAGTISTAGLGSTEPIVEEHESDGSDNPTGRQDNRRVEVVVRSA